MGTGHATIRGRNGTSASGKKVSTQSSQYSHVVSKPTPSKTQIKKYSSGVVSKYTQLTEQQKTIRESEYLSRLKTGKTGKSQSTQHVDIGSKVVYSKGVQATPLHNANGEEIGQIQFGKGRSHIVGIVGKSSAISDDFRQKAYKARQQGKYLTLSKEQKEKVANTARSFISSTSVADANKYNDYANRPIVDTTNAIDRRRISLARNIIGYSLPEDKQQEYFNDMRNYDKISREDAVKKTAKPGGIAAKFLSQTPESLKAAGYSNDEIKAIQAKQKLFKTQSAKLNTVRESDAEKWTRQYETAISGKTPTWSKKVVSGINQLAKYASESVDDKQNPRLAVIPKAVGGVIASTGSALTVADMAGQTKGKAAVPKLKQFGKGVFEWSIKAPQAEILFTALERGVTKDPEKLQKIADMTASVALFEGARVGVPKAARVTGKATGLIREKTFVVSEAPYHGVGSQAQMLEAVTKLESISGARGTTPAKFRQQVYGDSVGIETYKSGNKKYTQGSIARKLERKPEQYLTAKYSSQGQYGSKGPYRTEIPGQYLSPDLTGGAYDVVGAAFVKGGPFKSQIHLLKDVQTAAASITKLEKAKMFESYAKEGKIALSDYKESHQKAFVKSKEVSQPVATITPKTGRGNFKPEQEVLLAFGDKASTTVTSKRFVGLSDKGLIPVYEVRLGTQAPVPKSLWVLENIKYNVKNIRGGEYIKGMATIANRKIAELEGNALMKKGQYTSHGPGHMTGVEKQVIALRNKSPTYAKAFTEQEAIIAAKLHDAMRVWGKDTGPIEHGHAMAQAIRKGLIKYKPLNDLPKTSQLKIAKAIDTHMTIKPLNIESPTLSGLKSELRRPNHLQKALASADRLDRASKSGYIKKNMVFKLPEETTFRQLQKVFSESKFITDETAALKPKKSIQQKAKKPAKAIKNKNKANAQRKPQTINKKDSYYSYKPKTKSKPKFGYLVEKPTKSRTLKEYAKPKNGEYKPKNSEYKTSKEYSKSTLYKSKSDKYTTPKEYSESKGYKPEGAVYKSKSTKYSPLGSYSKSKGYESKSTPQKSYGGTYDKRVIEPTPNYSIVKRKNKPSKREVTPEAEYIKGKRKIKNKLGSMKSMLG